MATPNYDINYNDKRFTEVEADKKAALNEVDVTYGNMIGQSDKYYQSQIDAAKDYAETQKKNQQQQTDFAIDKIEQQKEQAHKDYIKEQSGAYVDWQKQSNPYGVEAEKQAAAGLAGSGYSESSQVSMYNTYQNRVMTARDAYTRAVLNYDNAIKDAQLQNNALLAEIAYNALQKQLELSLQGFQYKNTLLLEKAEQKRAVDKDYYGRYMDVIKQINTENALNEEVRQANLANERELKRIQIAQDELQLQKDKFAYEKEQDAQEAYSGKGGGNSGGSSSKGGSSTSSSSSSGGTSKGTNQTTTTKKGVKSEVTNKSASKQIDMQSVLNLGLGPISASKLDSLVRGGYVREIVSGGKVRFQWTAAGLKQKQLYSKSSPRDLGFKGLGGVGL